MRRRAFIVAAAAGLAAGGPFLQTQRVRRVAVLRWDAPPSPANDLLRRKLAELGWVEGRNLALDFGWAEGDTARADALVAAMLRNGAEVIVASSTPAVRAALAATRSVPIVMAPAADPIANGFIASLSRPGGNVTGLTIGGPELSAKRLEILREAIPTLTRVAFLGNARDPAARLFAEETRTAGAALGIAVESELIDGPDALPAAFAGLAARNVQALVVQPIFVFQRETVAALALQHRLPTVSELRPMAEAGVLMTYGTSAAWASEAAAALADRILRGAAPADLPVERPTRIELILNLRTARALGLEVPLVLQVRADAVIE
jgi:putative ABC transport system substrate-binding protein